MKVKKVILLSISLLLIGGISIILIMFQTNKTSRQTKLFEEIVTSNKGDYIVKNVVYKGANLDFVELEKIMKQIRSECKKTCKINLYSDRQAYELDIMAGESNFNGYSQEQKNYLATHILAFWGIADGDSIEYYPNK